MQRRGAFALALVLLSLAPATAQDEETPRRDAIEARIRLDVDASGLEKELARVDEMLGKKRWDDALALIEKLSRDARARDVVVPLGAKGETFTETTWASLERSLRARLLALPEEGRAQYDLRNDPDAARLEDLARHAGETWPLAQLLAKHPASSRAPRAAVRLGERLLEVGEPDAAAARFREALDELGSRLGPEETERARHGLAAALALAGRDVEARAVADAGALAELGARERAAASEAGPPGGARAVAWSHEVTDWFAPTNPALAARAFSEPVVDADRVYLHDGSRAVALSLDTGKAVWRTPLWPGEDSFRHPDAPCRLAVGPSVVACAFTFPGAGAPLAPGAVVALDRAHGSVLWRKTSSELRTAAKIEDESTLAPTVVALPGVVIVALLAHHSEDELFLIALDARTGELRWRTFIAAESQDPDAPEPLLATGPSSVYVLSGRGVIAALDPETGSVQWLRRYPSLRDEAARELPPGGAPFRGRRRGGEEGPPRPVPVTRPGFVGFAHGKVLVAPPDATFLFAYEARTGSRVFATNDGGAIPISLDRGELLEIGADGTIARVGRTVETVLKNPSGKLVGRPALAGSVLLVPDEGGVVRLDLAKKGDATLLTDWAPVGAPAANVAAAGRHVVLAGARRTVALAVAAPTAGLVADDARSCCRALGDANFATREAAQAKLLALGDAAREELAESARSLDPEVRLRAVAVLDELGRRERLASWQPRIKKEWLEKDSDYRSLLDRLVHPNPEVRLAAVRDLGKIGDEGVKVLLQDLLGDRDARVAGSSAIALLRRGDRSGMDKVAALIEAPDVEDRLAAASALWEKGRPEDLRLFEKAARDEEAKVRMVAYAGALLRVGDAAVALAEAGLDDKEDEVRMQIANVICGAGSEPGKAVVAKLETGVAVRLLSKIVKDPQRAIRLIGIDPLGKIETREAIAAVADLIVDPDPAIAKQARVRVINVKDVSLIPREAIEKALDVPNQPEPDRYHFTQMAAELLREGSPFAPGPLARTALEAKNETLRDKALDVLFAAVDTAPVTSVDVAAIGSLTCRDDLDVRFQSFQILAKARGPGRAPFLLRGLEDRDEQVRRLVRRVLPLIADVDLLVELVQREARGKPEEQAVAAEILSERADSEEKKAALVPALLAALDDAHEEVRAVAWKRLRQTAQDDVDLGLFEPAGDEATRRPAVRRAALWWWEKTHDGKTLDALVQDLRANAGAARFKAAKKLGALADKGWRSLVNEAVLDGLAVAAAKEDEDYVLRQELATLALLLGRPELALKEGAAREERARIVQAALSWRLGGR